MSYTSAEDIRLRMVGASEEDFSDDLINIKITETEDRFGEQIENFEGRIETGEIPVSRVIRIVSAIVIDHLQNPMGYRTIQDTKGNQSSSLTFAGDSPGKLMISSSDIKEMLGKPRETKQSAFVISTLPQKYWR